MVIAQNLKPALTRRAMGIDQCLRVDLEMLFGSVVHLQDYETHIHNLYLIYN